MMCVSVRVYACLHACVCLCVCVDGWGRGTETERVFAGSIFSTVTLHILSLLLPIVSLVAPLPSSPKQLPPIAMVTVSLSPSL